MQDLNLQDFGYAGGGLNLGGSRIDRLDYAMTPQRH